jgi:histidinol dehydrogenase
LLKVMQRQQLRANRSRASKGQDRREDVLNIIEQVKQYGDQALLEMTERFDRVKLAHLKVQPEEFDEAFEAIDDTLLDAIRSAIRNIRDYHERQVRQSWMNATESGTILGQLVRPLERVGIYVPGGTASYPSSVMMNAIPALVAGVEQIVMTTPPGKDGRMNTAVLVTARELGITEIFKVGGAQAIAALAYGTESIAKVDKITGPGNAFVAAAKREVYGDVDIDMIAGPSEVVILADETAKPEFIAADLLAQAEHDPLASAILVTTSAALAEQVQEQVLTQLEHLNRKEIAVKSIDQWSAICIANSLDEAFDIVNELATEHLQLCIADPFERLGKVKHAGAVFIGNNSPVPIGDYYVGPNHVLPTSGRARFSSPLSVDDFIKKMSLVSYSRADMAANGHKIAALAEFEGLQGHAHSVKLRLAGAEESSGK